jgi:DNA-binding response OmpR family regulator
MAPNKPTVLIIDDDLLMLELYRRELGQDYAILTCTDRNEALTLFDAQPLSAVVLEPALAEGRGWELLVVLRLRAQAFQFPVILCSILDERKRGMEGGAAAFLVKPVLPAHLRDVLQLTIGKNL